jgi:predicted nucleic acid-binding protein
VAATVYLDTNVFIHAFEGADELSLALTNLFAVDTPQPAFATSELTLAELLVHPYRHRNEAEQERYDSLIRPSAFLKVGPIDRSILMGAALLRSSYRLKLPDAIHISTALHFGCELLLTGDRGLEGSFSLQYQSTGQQWSSTVVHTVALDVQSVMAATEHIRT